MTVNELRSSNDWHIAKPVEDIVEKRIELEERMDMMEQAAETAAYDLSGYLLKGVTEGIGCDVLCVPYCKEVYYQRYRKFFWMLDKSRKQQGLTFVSPYPNGGRMGRVFQQIK